MAALHLGPFRLEAPIGAGGMAVVWRGTHAATDTPVAVKLMTPTEGPKRHIHRRALENEVRAMARLDHPGIVAVLDFGEVAADAADPSVGLIAGSPFLVMELAEAGPLMREEVRSYGALRSILSGLLRALAHAHARGVIHRDLKPSNVLFDEPGGSPRLTDFGIAHAIGRARKASGAPLPAGTAWFMAPEQVLGLHRDEGPATDLYALGCLAYLLVCGRPPFASKARDAVYRAHCLAEVPSLVPRYRVPAELEAWVHVLLSKLPQDRFACAADAAAALEQIGGRWLDPSDAAVSDVDDGRLGSEEETFADDAPTRVEMKRRFGSSPPGAVPLPSRLLTVRPTLGSIPPPRARSTPPRLLGVGLGVHGLRPIPLAGRQAERERLWRSLVDVARDHLPRAAVVRGRAGLGKTRLTEWLVETAAERGAARILWVLHDREPTAFDGPARMLRRHFRLDGLDRMAIDARLDELLESLDEGTRRRLATWLAPETDAGPGTRPDERFAIATDVVAHLGRERPVMLVFDDVQHGPESIAFVRHLLRTEVRALAVLTARDEALDERPDRARRLQELVKRPGVAEIVLEPLPKRSHVELVESLLGLGPALARTVAERTMGSPLFAVQLVGDWVQRGVLVPSDEGFALAGEVPPIPDDIHDLWSERVDGLVRSFPEPRRAGVRRMLSAMAALGRAAPRREWEQACRELGLEPEEALLDRMAARRLARVGRARYSLVHGMLHESLERDIGERGESAEVHAACARALAHLHPDDDLQAERIAHHLDVAGQQREALDYFVRAAHARTLTCDFVDARRLAARYDAILDAEGVPDDDARRLESLLVLAEVTGIKALLEENERILRRAEAIARRHGSPQLSTTLWLRGGLALKRGELERACELFDEAVTLSERTEQPLDAARSLHGRAEAKKLLGDLDGASADYEEASKRLTELGDALGFGRARMGIADVHRRRGELDTAMEVLEQSVYWMRRWGNRHSAAVGINSLGDIARISGDLDAAREHYREALRLFDSLESAEATLVRLNLGLVLLAKGDYADAREVFQQARPVLERAGRGGFLAFVVAGQMASEAGLDEWDLFEARERELDELLAQSRLVDDDLAFCLERVGDLAAAAGDPERARRSWERTAAQWEGLERAEAAARVRGRIDALGQL